MLIVAALIAFFVTTLFVFMLYPVAQKLRLVDLPGGRKRHDGPVPLIGGIAMCMGLTFGTTLIPAVTFWSATGLAIYLLVIVGTIDDRFDLPAGVRLIAQCCVALLVIYGGGVIVESLGAPIFSELRLGLFSEPFTILFLITVINAFNVIDGIDGLCGGLSLVALVALAVVSANTSVFPLTIVIAAAVAGFLLFNLPLPINRSVRVFMGDAGSTFLGLVIATLGIYLSQGTSGQITPPIGLWFIAVPVFDLFSATVRRMLARKSPFAPDHEHLHHALVETGLSRRETLIVMLSIALALAVFGLFAHRVALPDGVTVPLWIAANVFYYQLLRKPIAIVRVVRLFRPQKSSATTSTA